MTANVDYIIKTLQNKELTVMELSNKLGCSEKTVTNLFARVKESLPAGMDFIKTIRNGKTYYKIESSLLLVEVKEKGLDEIYENYLKAIGRNKEIESKAKTKNIKKYTKNLVIADPHNPWINEDVFKKIISEHGDSDTVIVAGDIIDLAALSKFSAQPFQPDPPLNSEIISTECFLSVLNKTFSKVKIVNSNHHHRPWKYFIQRVSPEVLKYINVDIVGNLIKQYPNIELVNDTYTFDSAGEAQIGHFTKLGKDCLIGHFETSSRIPMKAVVNVKSWVDQWCKMFFPDTEIKMILNGHNHQAGKILYRNTILGAIPGLCKVMPYVTDSGAKYGAPVTGYWIVYQDKDGNTDINNSNFYLL